MQLQEMLCATSGAVFRVQLLRAYGHTAASLRTKKLMQFMPAIIIGPLLFPMSEPGSMNSLTL